jgi:hypothetical protein
LDFLENQAKILGFPWIYSSESGLFNGLRAKKIKKIDSRLKLCAKRLKRFVLSILRSIPRLAATRLVRGARFSDNLDKIAYISAFRNSYGLEKLRGSRRGFVSASIA